MTGQTTLPGFDDGKAPNAMRTIGEVAKVLGIRQHVLRYWEEQFPMLKPVKRSGGRRYYRPADVELIVTIDRLVHHQGYTLRGARQAIESGARKTDAVPAVPVSSDRFPAEIIPQIRVIRDELAAALAAA